MPTSIYTYTYIYSISTGLWPVTDSKKKKPGYQISVKDVNIGYAV